MISVRVLLLAAFSFLIALPGAAQAPVPQPPTLSEVQGGEVPLRDLLREDGTLDLTRARDGRVDLDGFQVTMGADGTLRARAEGDGQWLPGEQVPGVNGEVNALAWGPDGALYVGGEFTSAGGVSGADRIARWTPEGAGGAWSALGSGVNGLTVYALAWGPDGALYVGGDFGQAGGVPGTWHIARWSPEGAGGVWSALGSGVDGFVRTLALSPDGTLYVGGWFFSASQVSGTSYVARWTPDGTGGGAWSALGAGVTSPVWALSWGPDGALYVGGQFGSAGGPLGPGRIARWTPDGTGGEWSALGSGVNGVVSSLAWGPDGALYVGGGFTSAGEVTGVNRIARWTPDGKGGTWSALGSGVDLPVEALSWGADDVLYVGGRFTTAGGVPSAYFARWASNTSSAEPDTPRAAPLAFEAAYPNPFTTRTTFVFSVATPADVHLAVYDVLGRRVATLAEEHVGAGTHERVFDGAGLPNGTYLVRLRSGGVSQMRRVLLLR